MKKIEFSTDEIKILVSFLATSDSNISRFVMMARNENQKELFDQLVSEKKTISGILEKLLKK